MWPRRCPRRVLDILTFSFSPLVMGTQASLRHRAIDRVWGRDDGVNRSPPLACRFESWRGSRSPGKPVQNAFLSRGINRRKILHLFVVERAELDGLKALGLFWRCSACRRVFRSLGGGGCCSNANAVEKPPVWTPYAYRPELAEENKNVREME